jgi:hypothetical protein
MFVDTFVRVGIKGLSMRQVAEAYAAWMLGTDAVRNRKRRLETGVHRSWTVEQVLASEPLVGDHGCRVDMRFSDNEAVVRFVHRDSHDGAVFWSTVARMSQSGEAVALEHAVGRDAPRNETLDAVASPSRIVANLLDNESVEISPRELHLPLVTLRGDDARGYVDHELVRPGRAAAVLVVACDRAGAPPVVDVELLAKRLRGLVSVAFLETEESTFVFGDTLAKHGFGTDYRCFHGGVHLFGPTAQLRVDHRLWLADTLCEIPEVVRSERLAGLIARRLGLRTIPAGFFNLIEEYDRREKRLLAERLVRRSPSSPPQADLPVTTAFLAQLQTEASQLRLELQATMAREREYADAWSLADDERRAAEQARDDADARLEQERAIAADLRGLIAKSKSEVRTGLTPELQLAMGNLLGGEQTPEDCLRLLALMHPDRIVVLDSALSSARKSRGFKYTEKLGELLKKLATGYIDALAAGKGDAFAAAVLGDSFAAKESTSTMASQRAREERTFHHDGRAIVMWPHLKIGVKESTAETIRVHFEWLAAHKKIVVGWCGEHRFRVG